MTRKDADRFTAAHALLADAIAARAFPAAAVEVGRAAGPLWRDALGTLTWDAGSPPARDTTIFDLASLTKVMATATVAMRLVDARRISLDEPVAARLADWRGRDREDVTIRDLLEHCSGLTSYLPLFRDYSGRREFEHAIAALPLEHPPRTQAVYSDLGFMLLGFLLEDAGGAPLDRQFAPIAEAAGPRDALAFRPPRAWRARCAPTEVDPWRGRLLAGEVHDENAWALGGVAAHAGLFGTAAAVGGFARLVLQTLAGQPLLASPATLAAFLRKSDVPGSSRALGWDTMLSTSSCGRLMSPSAVGHTGFTGTSLWIDPQAGVYAVLLTNRVHPTRENEAIQQVRPLFHDAVMNALRN